MIICRDCRAQQPGHAGLQQQGVAPAPRRGAKYRPERVTPGDHLPYIALKVSEDHPFIWRYGLLGSTSMPRCRSRWA